MHASVCDMITDLTQNAFEAHATEVRLEIATSPESIRVVISDNGKGMDDETLAMALDPFYSEAGKHAHRRVGLGLPLLMQTVTAADGKAEIRSKQGSGTTVAFTLDRGHWDTPPLGNLPAALLGLMNYGAGCELIVERTTLADGYSVKRSELVAALGNLEEAGNLLLARDYLISQEESLTN